jgi:hypothetical protein
MEFTEFSLRLLLIFLPGIIFSYIVDSLTMHPPRDRFFFILKSFVSGSITYFIYFITLNVLAKTSDKIACKLNFLTAIFDKNQSIDVQEICYVCISSVILACLFTYCVNYKLGNRIAQKLRLTRKFAEMDVWGYVCNLKEAEYATVRDIKNQLAYDGWIQAFSDNSREAEMFLRDVMVCDNNSGKVLYKVGGVYLAMNREDIAIELRGIPYTESEIIEDMAKSKTEEEKDGKDV